MRNAMVVSVQRAPLLPSSLPGYLSPTEMSRPVLSGHVIALDQSGAGVLWSPARPCPLPPHLSPVPGVHMDIITIPGDTCLHSPHHCQAPHPRMFRVANQGNKRQCHFKLMTCVTAVTWKLNLKKVEYDKVI